MRSTDKLAIIMFSLVATTVTGEAADGVVNAHNTPAEKTPSSWDVLKSAISVYTSNPVSGGYFGKLKASVSQAYLYMFPPDIDFRVSEKEGGKAKAREAVGKSLGETKETVEVSAKNAAHKLKNTISSSPNDDTDTPDL